MLPWHKAIWYGICIWKNGTYVRSGCIQWLTGFIALREYRSSHSASRVYFESEELFLDITRNFLDLESFRLVYTHSECFYVSMPKINLHALKEESERARRSAKSAESAFWTASSRPHITTAL